MAVFRDVFEQIEKFFLEVVLDNDTANKERSFFVRLLLFVLKQLSRLYSTVMRLRLLLYQHRILRHHTLGCQVISVGNLTVGGTGKTPVVEIFARRLQQEGRKVAILSRGYKKRELPLARRILHRVMLAETKRPPRVVTDGKKLLLDVRMSGDEPFMLASHLTDVAVLVDKDRVKSGRYAINKLGCDTLLLDDGFQYLAMEHRIEIVLVDRHNPFGNGHVLPRGILREPFEHIRRAHVIFITKCDGGGTAGLKEKLRAMNPRAEIIECRHMPRYLQDVYTEERKELSILKDKKIVALSGIAAPKGFEDEIQKLGAQVVEKARFADHHRYNQQEIIDIINKGEQLGAHAIITTEKDAVRLPFVERRAVPILFLRVDIELLSGTEDFNACISRICFKSGAAV